jgi:hypothetical protein
MLGIGVLFAVGLTVIVRIPAFDSPRVRLATLVGLGVVVLISFAIGSLWAQHSVDQEAKNRTQSFRRVLRGYRTRPLEILTGGSEPTFPAGTETRSEPDAVTVHSEVSRLWVYRCVQARVSADGVTITTTNGKCHW